MAAVAEAAAAIVLPIDACLGALFGRSLKRLGRSLEQVPTATAIVTSPVTTECAGRTMTRRSKYLAGLMASALMVATIMGCATGREVPAASLKPLAIAEVQSSGELATRDSTRPTVALVLGGGGLRGFAHVGVLSALEELGVHPDFIIGTSAGAVVGAAYASGLTPDQIKSAALDVKIPSLIDITLSTSGLIRGDNLASWIDGITGGVPIEKFPRRFAAVATDLQTGQAVLLDRGAAGGVVRASSAVPGINMPVAYDDGHLIDGGVTSLVPVRFARAMGADVVIAVDIYCRSPRAEGIGASKIIGRVMHTQSCLLAEMEVAQADILISPMLTVPSMSSREEKERVIRQGYDATVAAIKDWQ